MASSSDPSAQLLHELGGESSTATITPKPKFAAPTSDGNGEYQSLGDHPSLPWYARRAWLVALGLLMAAAGLAFFIVDFAQPPALWPYRGYNVTILTAFPYKGLQWSQWNIAIPFHMLMIVTGVTIALLAMEAIYREIYERSQHDGINGYIAGVVLLSKLVYVYLFIQVCNIQDLMMQIAIAIGFALSEVGFLYNFIVNMGPRLLALRETDKQGGGDYHAATHGLRSDWLNYWFAFTMLVFQYVYVGTYGIYSLQYYQSVASGIVGAGRYWIILSNLIVYFIGTLVAQVLFAVRYMKGEGWGSAMLRQSSVFDVVILIIWFVIVTFLGVGFLVAGIVGQDTY